MLCNLKKLLIKQGLKVLAKINYKNLMTFREFCRVKNVELTQKYNVYAFQLCLINTCMFLNEYRSLFADFFVFKFYTSAQICIYFPTFVLVYTLCSRCCST